MFLKMFCKKSFPKNETFVANLHSKIKILQFWVLAPTSTKRTKIFCFVFCIKNAEFYADLKSLKK